MVELLNVKEFKKRLDFIMNGGTNHEMLYNLINEKINKPKQEIEILRAELIKIDAEESKLNFTQTDCLQIHLFPIGIFLVPQEKIETLFMIFKITDRELKSTFELFFKNDIIPVINTYIYPITTEGPMKGNLEYKGFESYKNMYNARKAFYENKFYRIKEK